MTICPAVFALEVLWSWVPLIVPAVVDVLAKVTVPEELGAEDVAGEDVPSTKSPLRADALNGPAACGSKIPKNGLFTISPMQKASLLLTK